MTRFFSGAVVGAVAVLTLTGTAYAATGGTFVLGRSNAASSQTLLTSSGTGPVLALSTRTGQVPLAVSAAAGKATNLNADRLDGLDAGQLQRRITTTCLDGDALAAVGAAGDVTCVGTTLSGASAQVSAPSGVVRVACPLTTAGSGDAISGGYLLPDGVVAVATGSSTYRDTSNGTEGYNARFTNLDGSPYTGTVDLNVVCQYEEVRDQAPQGSLRSGASDVPPMR